MIIEELGQYLRNMRDDRLGICLECGRETDRFVPPLNNWWCRECQEKRDRSHQLAFHRPA